MMKRLILVLLFSIILLISVFGAGTSSFFFQGIPYAARTSSGQRSVYGFGGELGYRYNIWRGVKVGADLSYKSFSFPDQRQGVFSLIAKAGWKQTFGPGKNFAVAAYLGLGADIVSSSNTSNVFFAVTASGALAYKLNNHLSVMTGLDYGFLDRSVTAKIGMIVTLSRFPYHGAGVGLIMDGKILMGKRLNTPLFSDKWAVPGGTREKFDADDFATATRELKEEMAINLENLDATYIGQWSLTIPFFSWKTYFYSIDSMDQQIVLKEFSEYRWLEIDKILDGSYSDLDFRPFTRSEMKKLAKLLQETK